MLERKKGQNLLQEDPLEGTTTPPWKINYYKSTPTGRIEGAGR